MRVGRGDVNSSLGFQVIADRVEGRRVGVTVAIVDVILRVLETDMLFVLDRGNGES